MYTFDENLVSDLHKDAYGYRPRNVFWINWNTSTDDEKQYMWDQLLRELEFTIAEDKAREINAINAFEVEIANAMDLGALTREDAIRWIIQSMDLDDIDLMYGGSFICYQKGLPYSMSAMFDSVINKMNAEVV